MFRGVGAGVACGRRRGHFRAGRLCHRVSRPRERVLLSPGDPLNVDQFFDNLLERTVVQFELAPKYPEGYPTVLLEVTPHVTDDVEEVHRTGSASSGAIRSACPVAPISAKRR
jgi:hypothetical protein